MALWPNRSQTYFPGPMVIRYAVSAVSGGEMRTGGGGDVCWETSGVLADTAKRTTSLSDPPHCLAELPHLPDFSLPRFTASHPAHQTPTGKSRPPLCGGSNAPGGREFLHPLQLRPESGPTR